MLSLAKSNYYQVVLQVCLYTLFCGWLNVTFGAEDLPNAKEYQIKAVYLHRFALFVTWPKLAFESKTSPFRVCVFGKDPFQKALDIALEREKIEERTIQIYRFSEVEKSQQCHILFISRSEQSRVDTILAYVRRRPVLTISDIDKFITNHSNSMIEFLNRNNQVNFSISTKSVNEAGLEISANLLKVATTVYK